MPNWAVYVGSNEAAQYSGQPSVVGIALPNWLYPSPSLSFGIVYYKNGAAYKEFFDQLTNSTGLDGFTLQFTTNIKGMSLPA